MKSDLLKEFGHQTTKHLQSLLSYWDRDISCQYANHIFWMHFTESTERATVPQPAKDIFPFLHYIEMLPHFEMAFNGQEVLIEKAVEFSDGRTSELFISLIPDFYGDEVIGVFYQANEIANLETALLGQQDIQKSKRLYEFISQVNDVILRAKSENEIYEQICEIAVRSGNFVYAWLGIEDLNRDHIKSLFWSGTRNGFSDISEVVSKENKLGQGPTLKAFREGLYYCCNDIELDSELLPLKEEALKYGYKSCIALPIKRNEKAVAVLKLFAPKANFFSDAEINLLERVAENISFALNTFSIEQKRIKAEQELNKVKQAVEQSAASIVITDINGLIEYVNPAFTILTGYTYEEAIGTNPNILKSGHTTDAEYKQMWQDLFDKKVWNGEFFNKKKNGEYYWEKVNISQVVNAAGEITNFIAVKEEITLQKEAQKEILRMNEELRAFSWHLQHIGEIEKNKLAIEMHDELGQGLIALKMELAQLKKHLFEDPILLIARVDDLLRSINEKVAAFTRIYNAVNPTMLKELGLETTLENLIYSCKAKSKILFSYHYELRGLQIEYNTNLALYRIIKEGLFNIISDSAATAASVSLKVINDSILLYITDNGKGFDPNKVDSTIHFGILGMRELTYAINGVFEIDSTIGNGTTIKVKLPL